MERITLIAPEGMLLTNGEGFWVRLDLGDWDSPDNYREVPIEKCEATLGETADIEPTMDI